MLGSETLYPFNAEYPFTAAHGTRQTFISQQKSASSRHDLLKPRQTHTETMLCCLSWQSKSDVASLQSSVSAPWLGMRMWYEKQAKRHNPPSDNG